MEKNTLARSLATYHVPGSTLACSSKDTTSDIIHATEPLFGFICDILVILQDIEGFPRG